MSGSEHVVDRGKSAPDRKSLSEISEPFPLARSISISPQKFKKMREIISLFLVALLISCCLWLVDRAVYPYVGGRTYLECVRCVYLVSQRDDVLLYTADDWVTLLYRG